MKLLTIFVGKKDIKNIGIELEDIVIMTSIGKELKKIADKLEEENRILREELEKKRKERKLKERVKQLQQEQENMQHEIETGIKKDKKSIETPHFPSRTRDIWL